MPISLSITPACIIGSVTCWGSVTATSSAPVMHRMHAAVVPVPDKLLQRAHHHCSYKGCRETKHRRIQDHTTNMRGRQFNPSTSCRCSLHTGIIDIESFCNRKCSNRDP